MAQYAVNAQFRHLHSTRAFTAMFFRQPNPLTDYTKVEPTLSFEKSEHKRINEQLKHVKEVVVPALHEHIKDRQQTDHQKYLKSHNIRADKYPLHSKVMIVNVNRNGKTEPRY
ncbi:hypothetical protein A0J61_10624, partial [Choanephora cucurbitarum]